MLKDEYILFTYAYTLTSVVFVRTTQRLIWNLVSNYIGFTLKVLLLA